MAAIQNLVNTWQLSLTASSSTTIPVINIPSEVRNIVIKYSNVTMSVASNYLMIQLSTNNGSSYISTGYISGCNWNFWNGTSLNNQNVTNGIMLGQLPSIATNILSGTQDLYNLNTSSSVTSLGHGCVFYNSNGIQASFIQGALPTTNINAFQITVSAGNITTGTFKIYGLN